MNLHFNWLRDIVSEPTSLGELLQSDESKQHDGRVGLGALEEKWQKQTNIKLVKLAFYFTN